MEFSEKVTRIARILLAVFLAALGGVLWLEARSPLAAALRAGQPYVFWAQFSGELSPKPWYALGIYQPDRRMIDIIHIIPPGEHHESNDIGMAKSHADTRRLVEAAESSLLADIPLTKLETPLPMLYVFDHRREAQVGYSADVPLDEGEALLAQTQDLRFWKALPRQFQRRISSESTMPLLDRLLLAIELHRMPPENLRAAWLPETEEQRRFFFGNIFAPPSATRTGGRAVAVDVLNATGRPGIASTATDVLRSNGADVVNVGNAPALRDRTVIYDRTGRAENAESVRDFLDCRQARIVTQISPKKLVDVTVVLAEDCAAVEQRGKKWNWLRF